MDFTKKKEAFVEVEYRLCTLFSLEDKFVTIIPGVIEGNRFYVLFIYKSWVIQI